jgi:hypothetical protein
MAFQTKSRPQQHNHAHLASALVRVQQLPQASTPLIRTPHTPPPHYLPLPPNPPNPSPNRHHVAAPTSQVKSIVRSSAGMTPASALATHKRVVNTELSTKLEHLGVPLSTTRVFFVDSLDMVRGFCNFDERGLLDAIADFTAGSCPAGGGAVTGTGEWLWRFIVEAAAG